MANKKQIEQMISNPVTSNEACFHMIIAQLEEIIKLLKTESPSEMAERVDLEKAEMTMEVAEEIKPKKRTTRKKKEE